MNVVDLILVAILACVTLHFYFRKKKKALSSGKEKETVLTPGMTLTIVGAQGRAGESLSGHLRGISA